MINPFTQQVLNHGDHDQSSHASKKAHTLGGRHSARERMMVKKRALAFSERAIQDSAENAPTKKDGDRLAQALGSSVLGPVLKKGPLRTQRQPSHTDEELKNLHSYMRSMMYSNYLDAKSGRTPEEKRQGFNSAKIKALLREANSHDEAYRALQYLHILKDQV